ncbi:MAG TPA: AsmA-like C-terminal region-containing protein, partial [Pirellulales bacterium]|nr:AsmA-like C-terminal region-containing protein [Pirellulales bacterium]
LEQGLVFGLPIRLGSVEFAVSRRTLNLAQLRAEFVAGEASATASIAMQSPFPVTGDFRLRDFELSQLAPIVGLPANAVVGRVNLRGTVQGPLADWQVNVSGSGGIGNARLSGLRVDGVRFGFGISRYGIRVRDLLAQMYDGEARGAAVIPFDNRVAGDLDLSESGIDLGRALADLRLGDVPALAKRWPAELWPENLIAGRSLSCRTSGAIHLTLPSGKGFEPSRIAGNVQFDVTQLAGLGIQDGRLALAATLADGTLDIAKAGLAWPGVRAAARGKLKLTAPFSFKAKLRADGKLEALPKLAGVPLVDELSGDFGLGTDFEGATEPLELTGTGKISLQELQLGNTAIGSLTAQLTADRRSLELRDIHGSLLGGSLTGSGRLPLTPDLPGAASLEIKQIDVGKLASKLVRLPVRLSAVTTADAKIDIPAGALANPNDWDLHASADVPAVIVNNVPLGHVHATALGGQDRFEYDVEGAMVGGGLKIRGAWDAEKEAASAGLLEIERWQIGKLLTALTRRPQLARMTGTLDVKVPFTLPAKLAWPEGNGGLKLSDVRWETVRLSDRIEGSVALKRGVLAVERLSGDIAGGVFRAAARIDLNHRRNSRVRAVLDRVNSGQLAAPFPELNGLVAGSIDVDLRGVLADPWRFVAVVAVEDGKVMSIPLAGFRMPLRVDLDPRSLAADVETSDASGQLGHGRLQLKLHLRSAATNSLTLAATLTDADVGPLLRSQSSGEIAGGRVTATVALAGQDVRGPNDLAGNVQAKLRNLQVTALPVFQNLTPYLTGSLASAGSNEGDLRARIGGGVAQIERLSVNTTSGRLFATGRVSLAGNLDLGVSFSTDPLPGGPLAPALLARVPLAAAGPAGWLLLANEFLANRVIYLDVTGTIAHPAIRLEALPILTSEATRFFLGGGF